MENWKNYLLILVLAVSQLITAQNSEKLTPCELEQLLSELVNPEVGYELQAAALKSQLRNKLQKLDSYQQLYDNDSDLSDTFDKRSVSSLARNGLLNSKRNVGALARSGLLRGASVDVIKRSLATLAKNGQLPSKEPDTEDMLDNGWLEEKRNLAAIARAKGYGYAYNDKRSVQSLARQFELPNGKRSMVSLIRNRINHEDITPKIQLPEILKDKKAYELYEKRNVGKLARDWMLPNLPKSHTEKRDVQKVEETEKRNLGALKNSPVHGTVTTESYGNKQKREVSYSIGDEIIPELIDQSAPYDYEELVQAMEESYPTYFKSPDDKRYLASIVRSGWHSYQPGSSYYNKRYFGSLVRNSDYWRRPQKRHIGSLARSGFLRSPSAFGPVHSSFLRTGRARSQTVGSYLLHGQQRSSIDTGFCRRCFQGFNGDNWVTTGLSGSKRGRSVPPPRVTALYWRRFRP